MEHVDSDFAPIRRSKKVVDSDKIVKAISDDLEQKNFTVLRKLNLVPIKKVLAAQRCVSRVQLRSEWTMFSTRSSNRWPCKS